MTATLRLESARLSVELLPAGASVRSLHLKDVPFPLVIGLADPALYGPANAPFFGATIGRVANRIGRGRLPVDGAVHQLSVNEPPNHLHGGTTGAWSREWRVVAASPAEVTLALALPDGADGYPGAAELQATFAVADDALRVSYEATVTRACPVNMTAHLYFNLSGGPDTRDHRLEVAADRYLPVDDALLPTGEAIAVAGTSFDFRAARAVRDGPPGGLDHNFCLGTERLEAPRPVARLACEASGVSMELATTECGLQVYDGAYLDGRFAGLDGRPIGRHGAIALEPQTWPDAPNRPGFPQTLLRPGERYRHESRYRFARA